jgi:hypothetical protein
MVISVFLGNYAKDDAARPFPTSSSAAAKLLARHLATVGQAVLAPVSKQLHLVGKLLEARISAQQSRRLRGKAG